MPEVLGQFVLSLLDEEESHLFRNDIANTAENESEVGVDSRSDFLDELVLLAHRLALLPESLLLGFVVRVTGVERDFIIFTFVLFKVHVVSEYIVLLSLDDSANHLQSLVPTLVEDANNNFHNLRLEHREPSEDSRDHFVSHNFQLRVDILYEI